jgi:hypothetical protein
MRWKWAKAAIFAHRRLRWVFLDGHKRNVFKIELEQVDRFLHQVAVLVAYMLKLLRRNAHIKRASGYVAVAGWLEPGLERLAIDLLLEGRQNLHPGVDRRCGSSCK